MYVVALNPSFHAEYDLLWMTQAGKRNEMTKTKDKTKDKDKLLSRASDLGPVTGSPVHQAISLHLYTCTCTIIYTCLMYTYMFMMYTSTIYTGHPVRCSSLYMYIDHITQCNISCDVILNKK